MAAMAVPMNVQCVSDARSWRRPFIAVALISLLPTAAVGAYRSFQGPPADPTRAWTIGAGILLVLLLIAGFFLYRERRPPKRRVTLDARKRRLEFVNCRLMPTRVKPFAPRVPYLRLSLAEILAVRGFKARWGGDVIVELQTARGWLRLWNMTNTSKLMESIQALHDREARAAAGPRGPMPRRRRR